MYTRRLSMFFISMGVAIATVAIILLGQGPSTHQVDTALGAEGDVLVYQANQTELLPCGAFETMRQIQPPAPATLAPTATPDPNAPTPAPTNTPLPAPTEDRVGFPENYATDFKLLFVFDRPDRRLVRAICGNDIAAQHQDGEPFAYGSVLLMISYSAKLDADGQPVLDDNGHYIGERLVALHLQRKEEGFGEAYGDNRAGEWEFIAFNADGSYQNRAETTNFCAACHGTDGGYSVDHVFRMDFFHEGESAMMPPLAGDNEVIIFLYAFHEPVLEVSAGTTVTWVNHDEATYRIVSADLDEDGKVVAAEAPLFDSGLLPSIHTQPRSSFRFTFEEPGEYLYVDVLHTNMVGRIIVTE